jgi:hypothetical protein
VRTVEYKITADKVTFQELKQFKPEEGWEIGSHSDVCKSVKEDIEMFWCVYTGSYYAIANKTYTMALADFKDNSYRIFLKRRQ